jgi:hypothetical protein
MKQFRGLSLPEVLIAFALLTTIILGSLQIIARGLATIKNIENYSIASNIAEAQFEVYKDRFHKIPFYDAGSPPQIDPNDSDDPKQACIFVNHTVQLADLPDDIRPVVKGADDFYHDNRYDLNGDIISNDVIEPMKPVVIKEVSFIPVVSVSNIPGRDINNIKHIIVTVYWKEVNNSSVVQKKYVLEGYVIRTKKNIW